MMGNRGQALQIGAVLLLGILVVLIAVWQATVIPEQNEQIEFDHNQDVQDQMLELHGEAMATTDSDSSKSASVTLGTDYPSRLLFVNPSDATGTLETANNGEVIIENADASELDGEQFWDGETDREYTTTRLDYTPDYNLFGEAPRTVFDHGVLYNAFDGGDVTLPVSSQSVVSGNTISLVMLDGEYRETGPGSIDPTFDPVSTQTETVRVKAENEEDPITITLDSEIDADTWEEDILGDEEYVEDVTGSDEIEIELAAKEDDEFVTYDLKLSKIGLGNNVESPDPAYLNEVSGDDDQVVIGEPHTITIDVRDKYNNPMSGITVEGSVTDGDTGGFWERSTGTTTTSIEIDTNGQGQAHFQFQPGQPGDIELSFEAVDSDEFIEDGIDEISVSLNATVSDSGFGDGGDGGIADLNPQDIRLVEATTITTSDDNEVGLAFERIDDGDPVLHLDRFRLSFVDLPRSADDPPTVLHSYKYEGEDSSSASDVTLPSGWITVDDGPSLSGANTGQNKDDDIVLEFEDSLNQDQLMIMSTEWVDDTEDEITRTKTYFFAVDHGVFDGFED